MIGSPQVRLSFQLNFSDRRVAEMASLLANGKTIPDGVESRLQSELDLSLELTAGMDDAQAIQHLGQVRQRAEAQFQTLTMLMSEGPGSTDPLLLMAHVRLQEQIQLASMGELDMPGFRLQIRQRIHNQVGSGEQTSRSDNGPQTPGPRNLTDIPAPSRTGTGSKSINPKGTPPSPGTGAGSGLMSPLE
jgi:hypothetical protein